MLCRGFKSLLLMMLPGEESQNFVTTPVFFPEKVSFFRNSAFLLRSREIHVVKKESRVKDGLNLHRILILSGLRVTQ